MRNKVIAGVALVVIAIVISILYPEDKLPPNVVIDHLVVKKADRKLEAYSGGVLLKTYRVALGREPVGRKQYEGDHKTPEGNYTIFAKNPNSAYHKNLGISYPDSKDIEAAYKAGKMPGGDVKIHGYNNNRPNPGRLHRWVDWTNGCVAVTNEEIDELYEHTPVGTPITLLP